MSEDLTRLERERVRELNAQLGRLKRCPKKEIEVASISRELARLEELQNIRALVRLNSLTNARRQLTECTALADAAMHYFEEALLNLDEDEFDNFDAALSKSLKLDRIERDSDAAGARYNNALLRLGWELSEAKKSGIIS